MPIYNPITDKDPKTVISNAPHLFSQFIQGAITIFFILGILYFFFYLFASGFALMSSSGDEKRAAQAKTQLTNAFVGLVIIFSVYAIVSLIEVIFSINLLSPSLPQLIK